MINFINFCITKRNFYSKENEKNFDLPRWGQGMIAKFFPILSSGHRIHASPIKWDNLTKLSPDLP